MRILRLRRGLPVSAIAIGLLLFASIDALATHLRGVTLSWAPSGTVRGVTFTIKYSQRWTYPNSPGVCGAGACPALNSTYSLPFNFGDGTTGTATGKVTSINQAEDWFIADLTVTHIYPTTNNYVAFFESSARISTLKLGHDQTLRMETLVSPPSGTTGNSSPVSSMPAIITVPLQATTGFVVAASDFDRDPLTFRLATTFEQYNSSPNSLIGNPPGLSVNSTTGQVTWTTSAIQAAGFPAPISGDLWTAQFMVEDRTAQNVVKSKVPVDVILKFVAQVGAPPTLTINPPGPLSVQVGTPISFTVTGNDVDANSRVTLNATGVPVGATSSNLNQLLIPPVVSTFNWTPVLGQGGSYVITYTATDDNFQQALRSITIFVENNLPPTVSCAAPITTQYNVTGTLSVGVADANGDALTVEWKVDGVTVQTNNVPASQGTTTVTLNRTYGDIGNHPVSVTVTDPKNASATCSTAVNVVKADQSIDFPALLDRPYGESSFVLSATATSALSVSYTVSGPATLAGDTVTLTGAGLVTIVASQAGDNHYNAAPDVTRSFMVTRPLLTVTARSASRPYGSPNPDLSTPLSITGFVLGETVAALSTQPTCQTDATTSSPVGSYAVTCSGAGAANYTISYVPGGLTVSAVQLTVTAQSASRLYGAANPDLSAPLSITGFVLSENSTILTTQPVCTTTATPASPVGSYAVTCSLGAAVNYTFDYVPGTLTVNAVQLTVTAASASRPYGSGNPDVSKPLSITGFVLGQTATALTAQPACSTVATTASPVGAYNVTCTGGSATNYTFIYINGTLTVNTVSLTVTGSSATRPYGSPNPDVSTPLSITGFVLSENASVLSAQPVCETIATPGSPVGSYPVTCSGGAAANYSFAYVPGSLAVTAVQLTVTARSATRAYGSANPDISSPLSVIGFVSGETESVLTTVPVCSTPATSASGVGSFPITCSGGSATNYTFAYVPGTLTVSSVHLTVTARSAIRPYGSANPDLSGPATITGFVSGENESVIAVAPVCATSATSASPVGTYEVTCAGGSAANYTFDHVPGSLTITAVQLTVTAPSASRPYGSANPDVSTPLSVTGFVLGENATALSAQPTCATAATSSSPVTSYPVTCSGGAATNYTFGYVPGTLTVTAVQLTVTAKSASRQYGSVNPDVSAPLSLTGFVLGEGPSAVTASPVCSTTATSASAVGSYPVTCSGGAATNYTFGYVPGTLSVTVAGLTVTAKSASRPYGSANPDVSAPLSISGFVLGQTQSALTAVPVCSTTATSASAIGPYPVTCSGGLATNYTFNYVPGALTVSAVQLTVTAKSASRPYGSANPDVSAPLSITGFVLGQNASALATQPLCATAATSASPVGPYGVTCGGASATNYTFGYVPGTLTVTRVGLTVTANAAFSQYSDPMSPLTYNITGFVNGDTASVVGGSPALATTATQFTAPGNYAILVAVGSLVATNYSFTNFVSGVYTIVPENAQATYTGLAFVSTSSATSSTALVTLRATIQDISAITPALDSNPGDIRTATVQFVNRDTNLVLCTTSLLTLFDPSDQKTASAACTYSFNIGAADSDSFTIGIVVGGNYIRNSSDEDAIVTVSKPLTGFITGGGYLVLESATGQYAGTPGSKANFGFNAKSKNKSTLQGKLTAIIRSNGRVYQIKSTAIESLSSRPWTTTAPGLGSFQSKGTLQDITNPLAPISLAGNLTIQLTFTDNNEPGSLDTLGLSIWDGGTLLFSSRWDGVKTVEQLLGGGNTVSR